MKYIELLVEVDEKIIRSKRLELIETIEDYEEIRSFSTQEKLEALYDLSIDFSDINDEYSVPAEDWIKALELVAAKSDELDSFVDAMTEKFLKHSYLETLSAYGYDPEKRITAFATDELYGVFHDEDALALIKEFGTTDYYEKVVAMHNDPKVVLDFGDAMMYMVATPASVIEMKELCGGANWFVNDYDAKGNVIESQN